MSTKSLKTITQILLLSITAIVPFLNTSSLYFPYISGKAYVFRTLVALAFFFWIWLIIQNQRLKIKDQNFLPNFKNLLVIAIFLFFLAQVFVSFFGVDPLLSFFSTIERMDGVLQYGFWLVYFLILISVFKKERDWKLFFYVFIIIAVLASLFAWFNYSSQIRLAALFGNSSYFAVFLLFAIGFCAIAIERKFLNNRVLNYLLFFLAGVFLIITLILTQTRGAYFGLAGGIFLFCLLAFLFLRPARSAPAITSQMLAGAGGKENPVPEQARYGASKKLAFSCGVILLLGVISITALFLARDSDFVQNTYILKRTTSVAKLLEDDTVRERFLTWQIAFKAFKEKPVFGWGPENFGSAFNKYYDYNIGKVQPWFDRAHNQPIDILATGGIVLFSFYLFWLAAAVYTIFRIGRPSFAEATAGKERKVLSFILGSIFFAYFLQGLFLFDILPTFLGLFPFLAFLVVVKQETRMNADKNTDLRELERINTDRNPRPSVFQSVFIGVVALFSLFIIWATVLYPYKANIFALKFLVYTESGIYQGAKKILEQSFVIKSPYTFWEVRKRSGWQFVSVFDYNLTDETISENIEVLKEIYDYITPELERFIENRPYDPQIYFITGKIYRLGSEKLGKNDLDKAEIVLRKGFNYSDRRMEYYNEMAQVLILEGKLKEGEDLVREHMKRISNNESLSYVLLGHFYFAAEKYDLAWEQYEKAREVGFKFYEDSIEYSRYIKVAEEVGEYQKIVDMAQNYLKERGPEADTYYNIAVGYLYLEEKEKAREFFLKAVELKPEYEEYRAFFIE